MAPTADGRPALKGGEFGPCYEVPASFGGIPRPSLRVEGGWVGSGKNLRRKFLCHPRECGRVHEVMQSRLAKAFVRAAQAGRKDLTFGDNL
jgi:hypothetical protein